MTEDQKAIELSDKLSFPVRADQVIMSHTPFKSLLPQYSQSNVLVIGGDSCMQVAKDYGFVNAVSSFDIHNANPNVYPLKRADKKSPSATITEAVGAHSIDIQAALVFGESVNWGLDIQILTDLSLSRTPSHTCSDATSGDREKPLPFPIYACNADIVYSATHEKPRYTQGAFMHCFSSLLQHYTDSMRPPPGQVHRHDCAPLLPQIEFYGKPFRVQYDYAELALASVAERSGVCAPIRYYGVGDNPRSDVRGANQAGPMWRSVLVRSGLFKGSENDWLDPALYVEDDVLEAVNRIIAVEEALAAGEANGE